MMQIFDICFSSVIPHDSHSGAFVQRDIVVYQFTVLETFPEIFGYYGGQIKHFVIYSINEDHLVALPPLRVLQPTRLLIDEVRCDVAFT
jgi:hypothetical protein